MARQIVRAKLVNQQQLLAEIAQTTTDPAVVQKLQQSGQRIAEMVRASSQATDADMLRGVEGQAGAAYFAAVGALLAPEWNFVGWQLQVAGERGLETGEQLVGGAFGFGLLQGGELAAKQG